MTHFSRIYRSIIGAGIVLACLVLFSFGNRYAGGEGYEVFLNDNLLLRHFGPLPKEAKIIDLQTAEAADKVSIRYYHCGSIPKNSLLTIRNDKSQILKKWLFTASKQTITDASCKAGEIFKLANETNRLQLYLSSAEVPGGRLLAAMKTPTIKKGF